MQSKVGSYVAWSFLKAGKDDPWPCSYVLLHLRENPLVLNLDLLQILNAKFIIFFLDVLFLSFFEEIGEADLM